MKTKIIILLLSLNIWPVRISAYEDNPSTAEFIIQNRSGGPIRVAVYPIGTLYNGHPNGKLYKFKAVENENYYIVGGIKDLPDNYDFNIAFDGSGISGIDAVIGYGKYRVDFLLPEGGGEYTLGNYVDVDWSDKNYPVGYEDGNFSEDLYIIFYSRDNIKYKFQLEEVPIPLIKLVVIWDQRTPTHSELLKTQNKGPFLSVPSTEQSWRDYPIIGTPHGAVQHINPGSLFTHLNIQSNVTVNLLSNKTMTVESGSILTLLSSSLLYLNPGCTLLVKNGGLLCNYGTITGPGNLIIEGGRRSGCAPWDGIIKNNTIVILIDSALFEIPDNSTLTLDSGSVLVLKPNSTIKFGTNSKLVLKNGARLIAINATFTSLSPSQIWDGIYLEDVAQDTITNCTIENASNGITIRNRYTAGAAPFSAEITGCTFSNNTTTILNYGLSASNSTNILFRNNNFTSSQLVNGFSRGVVMEYCPQGSLLIIDNVITNAETGVSILQSSPYIARNSITGQPGVEYGIYLDNSNGTVEYNIVNNFQYSLYGLYSSPYLLKNTFSNASIRNIELNASSIPVMRPLASGSTLYWLGGDNRLEGNPSNGGVGFSTEAFPEMDSGWNSVTLSSASNYMDGTVPPMLGGTFYTRLNYWGEDPPDSNKFIIQDGTIDYDPWTGGEPPPGTDGYQLNDIGFGLYDTVFTKSIGQNPSEDLFIQAYNKERTGKYNESITLYKQVITQYRTSSYAPISLTRIFNCAEKKRSSIGEYTLFESYFRLINTNNIYSRQLREIAEDYVIRAKVRQGRLNDAIADYNQMYQLNQNTPKGLHALLNKQSLERIRDNSYGQQSSNSIMFYQPDNNQTQSSTPKEFRLYQNYPNPFNAKSRIKYQIAKTTDVVLQVFDASGKHVRTLINGEMQPGVYEAEFDGTELASGFFYTGLRPVRFLKQRKWL